MKSKLTSKQPLTADERARLGEFTARILFRDPTVTEKERAERNALRLRLIATRAPIKVICR